MGALYADPHTTPDCARQHNAARGMHDAIVSMLLEAGADPKAINAAAQTSAECCEKGSALGVLLARAAGGTAE